jgi:hypothetical protein
VPYWRKLQLLLEQYDAAPSAHDEHQQHQGLLRLAAVDELLQVDSRLQLPHWLLDMLEVGHRAGRRGPAARLLCCTRCCAPPPPAAASPTAARGPRQPAAPSPLPALHMPVSPPTRPLPPQVGQQQYHGMSGATADPATLLRTYMRHGRLVDAAQLAEAHLRRASGGNPLQRQCHCSVWLPYQLLAVLQTLLANEAQAARQGDGATAEALQHALAGLQQALRGYMQVAAQDSSMMGKSAVTLPLPPVPGYSGSLFG